MVTLNDIQAVRAASAYSQDGEKIGRVGDVYVDDLTNEPAWATVTSGFFGTKTVFAPLDGATLEGDRLVLGYTKEILDGAPAVADSGHISDVEQQSLVDYYAGHKNAQALATTTVEGDGVRRDVTDADLGETQVMDPVDHDDVRTDRSTSARDFDDATVDAGRTDLDAGRTDTLGTELGADADRQVTVYEPDGTASGTPGTATGAVAGAAAGVAGTAAGFAAANRRSDDELRSSLDAASGNLAGLRDDVDTDGGFGDRGLAAGDLDRTDADRVAQPVTGVGEGVPAQDTRPAPGEPVVLDATQGGAVHAPVSDYVGEAADGTLATGDDTRVGAIDDPRRDITNEVVSEEQVEPVTREDVARDTNTSVHDGAIAGGIAGGIAGAGAESGAGAAGVAPGAANAWGAPSDDVTVDDTRRVDASEGDLDRRGLLDADAAQRDGLDRDLAAEPTVTATQDTNWRDRIDESVDGSDARALDGDDQFGGVVATGDQVHRPASGVQAAQQYGQPAATEHSGQFRMHPGHTRETVYRDEKGNVLYSVIHKFEDIFGGDQN